MLWNPAFLGLAGTRPPISGALPDIGSPVWALDASQLSSIYTDTAGTTPVSATGQAVARVNNLLGGVTYFNQGFANVRPTIQYNVQAGKPGIRFAGALGTDQIVSLVLAGMTNPGTLFQSLTYTLALCYRRSAHGAIAGIFGAGNALGGNNYQGYDLLGVETNQQGIPKLVRNSGTVMHWATPSGASATAGQLTKIIARSSPAAGMEIRVKSPAGYFTGASSVPSTPDVTAWDRVLLGAKVGFGSGSNLPKDPLVGDLFEFRFWNARATDEQVTQLLGYLDLAWGN